MDDKFGVKKWRKLKQQQTTTTNQTNKQKTLTSKTNASENILSSHLRVKTLIN